jgi:hypothetical protein
MRYDLQSCGLTGGSSISFKSTIRFVLAPMAGAMDFELAVAVAEAGGRGHAQVGCRRAGAAAARLMVNDSGFIRIAF